MHYHTLILFFLILSLWACKKINAVRPPCEAQYVELTQDTSYLSTPLVIPTKLIEEKLNNSIGYELLDNDKPSKGKYQADDMKFKVSRLGDIQVHWKDNVATYQVPLRVLIEKQIVNKKVLPMLKSVALNTEFSLRLDFKTSLDLDENWQLVPKTKFVSFKWLSEVKTLGGLISIKKMVERRIYRQMPQIVKNVDDTIRAKVHVDKAITRIWQNIQKPVIINRNKELVWFKINPIQFEMGTITTDQGNLLIQGRISATTETLVGKEPVFSIDSTLPPLLKRHALPNEAYVYMLSEISYEDINQILAQKLAGRDFDISGRAIKVKKAEVWGCGTNLVLHLEVHGGVKGDIYFKGTPQYEPDSQRFVIRNFDFEVQTQETITASMEWLLHSTFKEQMKNALSIPLSEKIAKIPEAIMQGIEKGKAGTKMDFIIETWNFKPQQIWVRESDIVALIIVNAQVRLEVEKI
jgi:hypothetical protein